MYKSLPAHIRQRMTALSLAVRFPVRYLSENDGINECAGECELCEIIQGTPEGLERCMESMRAAGLHSYKFGEPYIFNCHAGLVEIAAPVLKNGRYEGCLLCGPVSMWEFDDEALREIYTHVAGLSGQVVIGKDSSRVLSGPETQAVAEMLYIVAVMLYDREAGDLLNERKRKSQQQAKLAEHIHETKKNGQPELYPLKKEQELLKRVRVGDRSGARQILNELLGAIFYRNGGNIEVMKARSLELVVVISRAAVESGAALEKLLGLNYHFIQEFARLSAFEEICQWLVKVLDTFMDTVYETRNLKSSRFLTEALEYIQQNFGSNLTLEGVASRVFISPYYLSHLFKEELGITFIEYVTRVRFDQARKLLGETSLSVQDVAVLVGYEDASYFTKVFKKMAGVTPSRYRRGKEMPDVE